MSTPAYITKINPDGSGQRIQLFTDGYPTWAGIKLLLHYSEEEQVQALMDLGYLMNLGDSPDQVEGSYITIHGTDKLRDITRSFKRDGQDIQGTWDADHFTGGVQNICPNPEFKPYTYAWTPDGWFAAYPEDFPTKQVFMPLLNLIHDYHQDQFHNCEPTTQYGPYHVRCALHQHTINLLQPSLPRHLLPTDPHHPTNRFASSFPPIAQLSLDEAAPPAKPRSTTRPRT